MPKVTVNDIEMYYEIHGTGAPLVLIGGLGCNHLHWSNVLPALSEQFQVLIFDNRGAGLSTLAEEGYSTSQMAADVAGLMTAIGFDKAHVVGHSMGGAIAQQLALDFPDKIERLMLYATAAKFDDRCMFLLSESARLWAKNTAAEDLCRYNLGLCYSPEFFTDSQRVDNTIAEMLKDPYPMSLAGFQHQLTACATHDTCEALETIAVPTWVIAPELDLLTPLNTGQYLASRIPTARLITIPMQGHCFHFEQPEVLVSYIERMTERKLA